MQLFRFIRDIITTFDGFISLIVNKFNNIKFVNNPHKAKDMSNCISFEKVCCYDNTNLWHTISDKIHDTSPHNIRIATISFKQVSLSCNFFQLINSLEEYY